MKSGWEEKKLGEVLQKTETVNPTQNPDKEFTYIDVSSVNNKTFTIESTSRIKGKHAPSRARKLIKVGDIIFATVRPTLQRIAIVPEEYDGQVCSTGYFVCRANGVLCNRYLFYYLLTDGFTEQMGKLQKGASYPAVTDGEVKQHIIAYPKSLAEQQHIVAILDEAFAAIAVAKANAETNLQNARELFDSVLRSTFANPSGDWLRKKLEEVATPDCTLSYGIVQPGEEYPDGLPIVRPTDLTTKYIHVDGLKKINPKLAEGYKRTTLSGGELLLCVRGSTGAIGVASDELVGANVTRGIVPIRFLKSLVLPDYGYYLIRSEGAQSQIKKLTYGAALMQINIRDLRTLELLIPPLDEQQSIVAKLDALSLETKNLETIYRQKLADLDELKKSILHKAFSGDL